MFGGLVLCVGTPQGGQPIDFENPDPRERVTLSNSLENRYRILEIL